MQQAQLVSVPRETEGKEKDEGSLSIPKVPIESREIRTAELPRLTAMPIGGLGVKSGSKKY
jgi:hypothetical protein